MTYISGSGRSNASECGGRYVNVTRKMDSSVNISPKMSHGVLECDVVTSQNYTLMVL